MQKLKETFYKVSCYTMPYNEFITGSMWLIFLFGMEFGD